MNLLYSKHDNTYCEGYDMETNYTVMNRKDINKLRHKAERRWYRRLVVINLLIIILAVAGLFASIADNSDYFEALEKDFVAVQNEIEADFNEVVEEVEADFNETVEELDKTKEKKEAAMDKFSETLKEFPSELKPFVIMLLLIIGAPFITSYLYAQFRSMSIKISEKNFPEIYAIVIEYTQKLGLKKTPRVYLIQGHGMLNAFAAFIPFKQYIELYADLVEVAYREHNDMETLRFIIGHEMAHIRLRHATLHYHLMTLFAKIIPIIGSTASRAREYSCDRIAQQLSGSDGIDAMMTLTAGIHLYKKVDKEDYIEYAKNVKGLFVWCYNLVSTHPVTSKRVLALTMKEGSGKLFF